MFFWYPDPYTRWASTIINTWSYKWGFDSPQLPIDKAILIGVQITPFITMVGAHLAPGRFFGFFSVPDCCFHQKLPPWPFQNERAISQAPEWREQETLRGMIYKLMEKIDNKVWCFTGGLGSWIPRKKYSTGEAGLSWESSFSWGCLVDVFVCFVYQWWICKIYRYLG